MKKLSLMLAMALALLVTAGFTGCATDGSPPPETSSYVATSCAATTAAMVVLTEAVEQDKLDQAQRDKVRQAQAVLRPICANPSMELSDVDELAFGQAISDIAMAHAKARSSD
jgi:hypothetical protein